MQSDLLEYTKHMDFSLLTFLFSPFCHNFQTSTGVAGLKCNKKRNLWQTYKNYEFIPIINILMHIVITTNINIIITFR